MLVKAFDTNIISYLLDTKVFHLQVLNRFEEELGNGTQFVIPSIVDYEILRGYKKIEAFAKIKRYENFRSNFSILDFSRDTSEVASNIYADLTKRGKPIGEHDLLISAFCIEHDIMLVTNNIKHFQEVEHLKLENWVDNSKL